VAATRVPEPLPRLDPGMLVADKFELIACIGRGGMGVVWKARHRTLGHDVAVKFLAPGQLTQSALARFEREARLSARLGEMSRHIARVYDHGTFGQMPFVVMELLSGESLAQNLAREHTLPLADIARIVSHLSKALGVAHSEGVVHRDLKPANIFLTRLREDDDFLVKLLDFGVAKACLEEEDDTSPSGSLVGTLSYMSPEQILGEPQLDGRADLWAVGVLTYRMATGRTPFSFGERADLVARILGAAPPLASEVEPSIPKSFDAWVERALAKRPIDRFADAKQMARALEWSLGLESLEVQRPTARLTEQNPVSSNQLPTNQLLEEARHTDPGHTESESRSRGAQEPNAFTPAIPASPHIAFQLNGPESVLVSVTSTIMRPKRSRPGNARFILLTAFAVLATTLGGARSGADNSHAASPSPSAGDGSLPPAASALATSTTVATTTVAAGSTTSRRPASQPDPKDCAEEAHQKPSPKKLSPKKLSPKKLSPKKLNEMATGTRSRSNVQSNSMALWDSDLSY